MAGSSSLFVSFPPAIRFKSAHRTSSRASGFPLLSGAFSQRITLCNLHVYTQKNSEHFCSKFFNQPLQGCYVCNLR